MKYSFYFIYLGNEIKHGWHFLKQRTKREQLKLKNKQTGFGISTPPIFNISRLAHNESYNERFHSKKVTSTLRIEHNLSDYLDIFKVENEIDTIFQMFFEEHTQDAANDDIVSMTIKHEHLDTPIYIHARKKHWDGQDFLNKIFQVSQSNTQFILDG